MLERMTANIERGNNLSLCNGNCNGQITLTTTFWFGSLYVIMMSLLSPNLIELTYDQKHSSCDYSYTVEPKTMHCELYHLGVRCYLRDLAAISSRSSTQEYKPPQ